MPTTFQSSSEFELGVVYPGTGGRSGKVLLIWAILIKSDVIISSNDSDQVNVEDVTESVFLTFWLNIKIVLHKMHSLKVNNINNVSNVYNVDNVYNVYNVYNVNNVYNVYNVDNVMALQR